MKVAENKRTKRQDTTILDVLFSSFKSKDLPIIDIMPYKRVTKEGFLVDKHNENQAYLRVKTNDLVSMNNSDLNRMISQLTSICRVYTEPFKILSMTYSTETSKQQMFWKSRINKYRRVLMDDNAPELEFTRHEVMLRLAVDNLRRVTWVEDNLTELTFFIVVYGKNQKELEIRVRDMTRLGGKQYDLQLLNRDNIEKILIRLNNMNTEV